MYSQRNDKWMHATLVAAGIYHILWGLSVIFFPSWWLNFAGISRAESMQMWQVIGMMTAVFGIGFLVANSNPMRYWPVILSGLLVKTFWPAGTLYYYLQDQVSGAVLQMHLTNDLVWWIPFAAILFKVYRESFRLDEYMIDMQDMHREELLDLHRTTEGESLYEKSFEQPVMIVFLRHLGCTFCRETLSHIAAQRKDIDAHHTHIAIVYQVEADEARPMLKKYGLTGVSEISDPEGMLYKGFKLKRGTFSQLLLHPKVLFRGFVAGVLHRHGIGKEMGDIYQMPGVFVLYKGEVVKKFIHETAADIPPYLELADCQQCT